MPIWNRISRGSPTAAAIERIPNKKGHLRRWPFLLGRGGRIEYDEGVIHVHCPLPGRRFDAGPYRGHPRNAWIIPNSHDFH